jgi:hypothetical protein
MIQSQLEPSNLEVLWLQVLEQLHPPILRALFQQKAALLTFNGANACIGLPSIPLARLAQKSLQNVASAFNQVLHQEIHVSIRVTAAPSNKLHPEPLLVPDNTASEEEVLAAAQSLAAFFDGEIISVPDNWTL